MWMQCTAFKSWKLATFPILDVDVACAKMNINRKRRILERWSAISEHAKWANERSLQLFDAVQARYAN